jgi:hypothetical protein
MMGHEREKEGHGEFVETSLCLPFFLSLFDCPSFSQSNHRRQTDRQTDLEKAQLQLEETEEEEEEEEEEEAEQKRQEQQKEKMKTMPDYWRMMQRMKRERRQIVMMTTMKMMKRRIGKTKRKMIKRQEKVDELVVDFVLYLSFCLHSLRYLFARSSPAFLLLSAQALLAHVRFAAALAVAAVVVEMCTAFERARARPAAQREKDQKESEAEKEQEGEEEGEEQRLEWMTIARH